MGNACASASSTTSMKATPRTKIHKANVGPRPHQTFERGEFNPFHQQLKSGGQMPSVKYAETSPSVSPQMGTAESPAGSPLAHFSFHDQIPACTELPQVVPDGSISNDMLEPPNDLSETYNARRSPSPSANVDLGSSLSEGQGLSSSVRSSAFSTAYVSPRQRTVSLVRTDSTGRIPSRRTRHSRQLAQRVSQLESIRRRRRLVSLSAAEECSEDVSVSMSFDDEAKGSPTAAARRGSASGREERWIRPIIV